MYFNFLEELMICNLIFPSVISTLTEIQDDSTRNLIDFENKHQFTQTEIQKVNACAYNLNAIGKALQAYENANGEFPEWLSDLHPEYLEEAHVFVCPADEDNGVSILPYDTDPKFPVSYNYDCNPDYYEQWLKFERQVYNCANPIVRCPHHKKLNHSSKEETNDYINLSFSNSIFLSKTDWKRQPIEVFGSLEAAIEGQKRALDIVPDDPAFFYIYPDLLKLYLQAERVSDAEKLIESFKSVMKPHDENIMRFRDYWTYIEMLKIFDQHEKALNLLLHLEETEIDNPFRASILREIAMIHEERGDVEKANEYFLRADSRLAMIGKPAPDFSITDVDGNTISLEDFHGEVLLLDFWSTTCNPCICEMPNVKKVYDEFNEMGFEVIAISLDEDETRLKDFLNTCNLPWRQVFTGEGWETPLRKLYKVRGIPSPWLIDKEGKVISYKARGSELRGMVLDAIEKNNQRSNKSS